MSVRILTLTTLMLGTAGCGSGVAVGIGGAGGGIGVGGSLPSSSPATEARALVDRINRHRTSIGCRALTWDDRLATVARRHSEDMAKRRFFNHTNPDGIDPSERLEAAKIRYHLAAENIAKGQSLARDTYDDWIESPGHRDNVENCQYTHGAVGVYDRHWTLVLVRYTK